MVETLNNLSESDKNLKTKKKRITVKKVNIPELVYSSQKAKEIRNKNDQKLKEKNNQNEEKELKQAMDYFYTPNPDFHLDLKKEIVGYDNRKDYNKSENNKNSLRIKKREENIRNWEQKKVDLAKDLESYKKNAFKLIEKIFKLRGKENYTENFKKAVELLKTKQIKQIIVAGNLANKDINIPRIDLDTWSSLKLLNNYNQKNYNETYTEGAETKIVGKDFKIEEYLKENANKDGDGIVIVLDTGGE